MRISLRIDYVNRFPTHKTTKILTELCRITIIVIGNIYLFSYFLSCLLLWKRRPTNTEMVNGGSWTIEKI